MKRFLSSPDGLPSKKQKSSLFGKSSQDADSSIASSSRPREQREVSSPFYPGRTMYGGAGAYRTYKYLNEPYKRKTPIMKPASKTDETDGMSQTAKRILDILQQYPSPLKEAKQLAPFMETRKNYTDESPLTSFSASSTFLSNSTIGPKSNYNSPQVLRGPSVSSLIKMHRDRASQGKPSTTESKTSPVARQISASQSSSLCLLPKLTARSQANDKYKSKMKNTLTRRPDKDSSTDNNILPPFKLPTAVLSLGSSNLPDFSLRSSPQETPSFSGFIKEKEFRNNSLQSKDTNGFAFSSPIKVVEKKKEFKPHNNFVFRKPINVDSSSDILLEDDSEESSSSKEALEVIPSIKIPDVTKSTSTPAGSTDNLTNSWGSLFKPTGNWQCQECWSSNQKEEQKCLACGAANSTTSSITKKASEDLAPKVPDKLPSTNLFSAKSKSNDDWKCKECWIVNKIDLKSCVACGTSAPSSETTVIDKSKVKIDNGFGQLVKEQQSQWECSSCLTRNEQARMKCACCEAPKPGTCNVTKEMNLEIQPTSTFKFGIDQTDSKKSTLTLDKNLSSAKDTGTAPSTGFSFGIALKDNPKVSSSFSFGVPDKVSAQKMPDEGLKLDTQPGIKLDAQPAAKLSSSSFTFGMPAPATASSDSKAEQILPKLDDLPQATGAFVFGVPTKADPPQLQDKEKDTQKVPDLKATSAIPSFGINTIKAPEKLKEVEKLVEVKAATSMPNFLFQVSQPTLKPLDNTPSSDANKATTGTITPSFNFGAPKPAQPIVPVVDIPTATPAPLANNGLFGSNISGTNPLTAFSSAPKSSPVTTIPPTGLFGSIAAPSVTSSALTQKPAELNTSMNLKDLTTTSSTAPLFNFGSSATTPKPAVGGFNFSFGAGTTSTSKPEQPPPAFGSPSLLSPANSLFGNIKPIETTKDNAGLVSTGVAKCASLFGAPQPASNLFGTSNAIQQPNATPPTFGGQPPAFSTGSNTTQLFGNASVTSPSLSSNMFGLPNRTASAPPPAANLFGTASPATPTFGSPAAAPAPVLQFGNSVGQNMVSPTFGSAPASTFGNLATSTPAPTPAFNFGASAASSPVFGFGQPQQPQTAAPSVYSFGASTTPAAPVQGGPGLQFNMGTFSTPTQGNNAGAPRRRIAKAVRRATPR